MLRLKERPAEWVHFTAITGFGLSLATSLLAHAGILSAWVPLGFIAAALAATGLACLRPRWFRGCYRVGMTLSYRLGQTIGMGLLVFVFFFVLTPIGLLLRLSGKDLLDLQRNPQRPTHWKAARSSRAFERMF
jgi:hypothetical protein